MKLYLVNHYGESKSFLFRDGRENKDRPIPANATVVVETMRGITDGCVRAGPLDITEDQEAMACSMFGAYLPIKTILAVGPLMEKHSPSDFGFIPGPFFEEA